MAACKPVISLEFHFPNEPGHTFHVSDPPPLDINFVSPEARDSNTSFAYSGRHDHGPLPVLKSEGPMSVIVSGLAVAKEISDKFLSARIDEVYGPKPTVASEKTADADDIAEADSADEEESTVRLAKKKRVDDAVTMDQDP